MIRKLVFILPAALLVGLAACGTSAYSDLPCQKCNVKYVTVGKHTERKVFCVIDGKEIDCKKNPELCTECKK